MQIHDPTAIWLLLVSISFAHAGQNVHIVARVPDETPVSSSIYLAGSLPIVGNWKPDGIKLSRQSDGTYAGNVELAVGETLEFKMTRGNWETVEKNADGSDRANRAVTVNAATTTIEVTVERWGSTHRVQPASTVSGTLKLHSIDSRALGQSRTIRVWLPPKYGEDLNARYDVLYMQDGQNCFDRATSAFGNEWQIDETLTRLICDRTIPPLIVVGIDNGLANRISEYTYDVDGKLGGGHGDRYAEFLLNEVKPFVEKTYRVAMGRRHTFIGGSSLGGLISLEIARRNPDTFAGVIAMSPTVWWARQSLLREIEKAPGGLAGSRVWIDIGTRESGPSDHKANADKSQNFIEDMRRLDAALSKHRVSHRFLIDDRHAEHNEPAWASRFPQAIRYVRDLVHTSGLGRNKWPKPLDGQAHYPARIVYNRVCRPSRSWLGRCANCRDHFS